VARAPREVRREVAPDDSTVEKMYGRLDGLPLAIRVARHTVCPARKRRPLNERAMSSA